MKTSELKKLLKEYQKRLRLMDWNITIKWDAELNERERYAELDLFYEEKSAKIGILPLDMWGDEWKDCKDISRYMIEPCIAHELLHVQFFFVELFEDKVVPLLKEQAVDITAKALVEAKYE